MATAFEALFPSLSIRSCISPAAGSSSGPRYEAIEKETGELFEVRCVSVDDVAEGDHRLSACRARGVALLSAKNRVPQQTCTFPEDYYCTSISTSNSLIAARGHESAHPQRIACIVSVTKRLGPSLWDIARAGSPGSPAMLPLKSFLHLMDCVSAFCRLHLTLPTHANITPNAFVLTSCVRNCCEWCVTDWCLDAAETAKEEARAKAAPDKIRRWEKRCLKSLASIFCVSLVWCRGGTLPETYVVGLSDNNSRPTRSSAARLHSGIFVIQPDGDLLDEKDVERYLIRAVCRSHDRPSTSPPSTSLQYVLTDDHSDASGSDKSPISPVQKADDHARMLATERLALVEDVRRFSAERDVNAPSATAGGGAAPHQPHLDGGSAGLGTTILHLGEPKLRPSKRQDQVSSVDDDLFFEPPDLSRATHDGAPPLPSLSPRSALGRLRPRPPRRPPPKPNPVQVDGHLPNTSPPQPVADTSPRGVVVSPLAEAFPLVPRSVPFGGASPPQSRPARASTATTSTVTEADAVNLRVVTRNRSDAAGNSVSIPNTRSSCCAIA